MSLIYAITFSYLPIYRSPRRGFYNCLRNELRLKVWHEPRRDMLEDAFETEPRSRKHSRPKANLKRHINSILWHKTRILITNFARLNNHQKNIISCVCCGMDRSRVPTELTGIIGAACSRTKKKSPVSLPFSICFNNNNSSCMLSFSTISACRFRDVVFFVCCCCPDSGTTHLGNKNKGREADTIEKQKKKQEGKKRNA